MPPPRSTVRRAPQRDVHRTAGRSDRKRWPDLAFEQNGWLTAIEIEFSPKGTTRLAGIIDAYLQSPTYKRVRYLMSDPATAARLTRIITEETGRAKLWGRTQHTEITVDPWPHLTDEQARAVAESIRRTRQA